MQNNNNHDKHFEPNRSGDMLYPSQQNNEYPGKADTHSFPSGQPYNNSHYETEARSAYQPPEVQQPEPEDHNNISYYNTADSDVAGVTEEAVEFYHYNISQSDPSESAGHSVDYHYQKAYHSESQSARSSTYDNLHDFQQEEINVTPVDQTTTMHFQDYSDNENPFSAHMDTESVEQFPTHHEYDEHDEECEYASHGCRHIRRPSLLARFIKAVSLALVCALLGGAAAYAVLEHRINRGDFDVEVTNVVLGSQVHTVPADYHVPLTVAAQGEEMAPEDLYLMAVHQVVGIRSEIMRQDAFGQQRPSTTMGSGFIISYDGYILTNHHVIEIAYMHGQPIFVDLYDGRRYEAEIVGFDAASDVALIKIHAEGLRAAAIGDSDNIRVGQTVYAIGNPFGELVYTMTDGIVSALDRVVSIERQTINTFQFSAAVNTGNSGGPVFNTRGEVIGIVTAKVARADVEGIGFAIPINHAIDIAVNLIELGYLPGRALIGVSVQTINRIYADEHGLVIGSRVNSLTPGGAAENAGIQVDDIIVALGGEEVVNNETLNEARNNFKAGDTAIITIWRAGTIIELSITFDEDLTAGVPSR